MEKIYLVSISGHRNIVVPLAAFTHAYDAENYLNERESKPNNCDFYIEQITLDEF